MDLVVDPDHEVTEQFNTNTFGKKPQKSYLKVTDN